MGKDIKIQKYNPSTDYEILKGLWAEHEGWVAPLEHQLPLNGLVATYKGEIIGCNFLYSTDSSMAITEFLMFSKKYKEADRSEVIDELITTIVFMARYNGFTTLLTWSDKKALKERYSRLGFVKGDGGEVDDNYLTNMVKLL